MLHFLLSSLLSSIFYGLEKLKNGSRCKMFHNNRGLFYNRYNINTSVVSTSFLTRFIIVICLRTGRYLCVLIIGFIFRWLHSFFFSLPVDCHFIFNDSYSSDFIRNTFLVRSHFHWFDRSGASYVELVASLNFEEKEEQKVEVPFECINSFLIN